MSVVTRFAPSPTGYLHIGSARTALFNWLYARHHQGRYLLRIEDTDRVRSTPEAVAAILDGLSWLGIESDSPPVYQSSMLERHKEVAMELLERGHAYRCYASAEELAALRERAKADKSLMRQESPWRDRDPGEAPRGVAPAIRFKAPREGETVINDRIQGEIRINNAQLDDRILLRSDGMPTYMLSVVVDDHDMGVTHIIRGDDHLSNTAIHANLFKAMGWPVPVFAHAPMIHGPDGAKLSKRHGATGVEAYREMGYLPEALCNYLLRLGWSHGDDEIISMEQAIAWFDLDAVGRSPSRFDLEKLRFLNAHYLRARPDHELVTLLHPHLLTKGVDLDQAMSARLEAAMPGLKPRASTLVELADAAFFYVAARPIPLSEKAQKLVSGDGEERLRMLVPVLKNLRVFNEEAIETALRTLAQDQGLKLGQLAQPLRAALTGSNASPGLFEVAAILGQDEVIARIDDCLEKRYIAMQQID